MDHLKLDQIRNYLEGNLSSQEMHAIENHLLDCDLCQEALEGMEGEDYTEVDQDLELIKNQLKDRTIPQSSFVFKFPYTAVAAALLLLMASFYFLLFEVPYFQPPQITQEIIADEGPSDIERMEEKIEEETVREEIFVENPVQAEEPRPNADNADQSSEKALLSTQNNRNPASAGEKYDSDEVLDQEALVTVPSKKLEVIEPDSEVKSLAPSRDINKMEESHNSKIPVIEEASSPTAGYRSLVPNNGAANHLYKINGKVTNAENGLPLPGVNVIFDQSMQIAGTVTDLNGIFELNLPVPDPKLSFSSIGFSTISQQVKYEDSVLVEMEPDLAQLEEMVVVGYGKKKSIEAESFIPARPEPGMNAYKKYLRDSLRYPSEALDNKIEGVVELTFLVKDSGEISDIQITKSLGKAFDQEAIRLIEEGPSWQPARKDGQPVGQNRKLRVRFKMKP
ncbi:MAG: TonB family protein [Candidatus Cyclobacteriaceae bacterium M3_2C_046]